jgi:hypothetical protein
MFTNHYYMKQKFTPDVLIRYLYREVSAMQRVEIEQVLAEDAGLRRAYRSMQHAYQLLPKVTFSPSRPTVQAVLKYSQRTALEQQV